MVTSRVLSISLWLHPLFEDRRPLLKEPRPPETLEKAKLPWNFKNQDTCIFGERGERKRQKRESIFGLFMLAGVVLLLVRSNGLVRSTGLAARSGSVRFVHAGVTAAMPRETPSQDAPAQCRLFSRLMEMWLSTEDRLGPRDILRREYVPTVTGATIASTEAKPLLSPNPKRHTYL